MTLFNVKFINGIGTLTYKGDGSVALLEEDTSVPNCLTVGFNDARTVDNDVTGIDEISFIIRHHIDGFGSHVATLFLAYHDDTDEMERYLIDSLIDGTDIRVDVYNDHVDGLNAWQVAREDESINERIFLTGYYGQNENVFRNAVRSSYKFLEAQRMLQETPNRIITRDDVVSFVKDSKIDADEQGVTVQRVARMSDLFTLLDVTEPRKNDTVGDAFILRQGNTDMAVVITRVDEDEPYYTGVMVLIKDDSGRIKPYHSLYLGEHDRIASIIEQVMTS